MESCFSSSFLNPLTGPFFHAAWTCLDFFSHSLLSMENWRSVFIVDYLLACCYSNFFPHVQRNIQSFNCGQKKKKSWCSLVLNQQNEKFYLKYRACRRLGYLRWPPSCLWSGWPAPGSHGPDAFLPTHTGRERTQTQQGKWHERHSCSREKLASKRAYLFIRAVLETLDRAGANKNICAAEWKGGKRTQNTSIFTSCFNESHSGVNIAHAAVNRSRQILYHTTQITKKINHLIDREVTKCVRAIGRSTWNK